MGELVGEKYWGYRLRRLQHKQARRVEVLGRDPLGRTVSHRWRNEEREREGAIRRRQRSIASGTLRNCL